MPWDIDPNSPGYGQWLPEPGQELPPTKPPEPAPEPTPTPPTTPSPADWQPGMAPPDGYHYDTDPNSPGFGQLLPDNPVPYNPPEHSGPSVNLDDNGNPVSYGGGVPIAPEPVKSTTPPADTTTLADGTKVASADLNKLPPEVKEVYVDKGMDAGDKALTEYKHKAEEQYRYAKKQAGFDEEEYQRQVAIQKTAMRKLEDYKTGDGSNRHPYAYDINRYLSEAKSPGEALQTLKDAGFDYDTIKSAALGNNEMAKAARIEVANKYSAGGIAKQTGNIVAEIVVPGYYTAKYWGELKGWEKAVSIGVDVLTLLPVVPAAAAGARGVSTAGRAARLGGAAKGVGREALAQVRAPIDTVLHPVATIKGTVKGVREVAENIVHPTKIPEAVITTAKSTVRLKVTEATTPKQAMQIRDDIMELAAKGEKPLVEVNGIKYELSTSPLMKETKGGLVHTTPQGEAFEKELVVAYNPKKPPSEQGLFLANQPVPRFTKQSAFGQTGKKPTYYITSADTAQKAISSEKLYQSRQGLVAEMERKLPVGFKLPEPKQKLFTRVGPERTRVGIYLEKPLSKLQIAKLKALGLAEDIKAPFKPAITISGKMKGLDKAEMRKLAKVLDESGNGDVARTLRRSERDLMRAGERTGVGAGRAGRAAARSPARGEGVRGRKGAENSGRRAGGGTGEVRRSSIRVEPGRAGLPRSEPARAGRSGGDGGRSGRPDTLPDRTFRPPDEPGRGTRPSGGDRGGGRPQDNRPNDTRIDRGDTGHGGGGRGGDGGGRGGDGGGGRKDDEERRFNASFGVGKPPVVHTPEDYANAVTWKQGLGWWIVFPDNTTEFSRFRPETVREVPGPGHNKPGATIQVYKPHGEIRIKNTTGDMGIQDIKIGRQGKRPVTITFKPDPMRRTHNPVQFGRSRFKSKKEGQIYRTKIGRGSVISREPVR